MVIIEYNWVFVNSFLKKNIYFFCFSCIMEKKGADYYDS